MTRKLRGLSAGLALAAGLAVLAGTGNAGGDKANPWKPILPADTYKELIQRESKTLQDILAGNPDEDKLFKAQFAALMIAGYTLSTKDAEDAQKSAVRTTALQVARIVMDKGKLGEAKKLALTLPNPKADGQTKSNLEVKSYLPEIGEFMNFFRTKGKGGEGLHPSLHLNPRFKTALNGSEELIRYLGMKKLTEALLDKASDELTLLAYRTAVSAGWTHGFAPAQKAKQDPKEWRELSIQMRDAAAELAEAAKKKNIAAVHDAGKRLDASCTKCHNLFRAAGN
jgi:hypothetical protein